MKIVAELSANHNGSFERALKIVQAVKDAGASAIKLQTWSPDKMVLDPTIVLRDGPWVGTNLAELYRKAHMPWESQRTIFAYAKTIGLECFSSVFDEESLGFLEGLGCPRYKIASFEIVDLPLIEAVASTKKPMIISTGMADIGEIEQAVEVAQRVGCRDLTLLKCTSAYPADGSAANLRSMHYLRERFHVDVGLSDHTPGIGVAITAIAWGARMIEKHVTLSRADGGLDAAFSIEPAELATLVRESTTVEKCLGQVVFGASEHERPQLELRRSLYFTQDTPAGTYLGEEHVRSARPAKGVSPRLYRRVLGSRLTRDVRAGQAVQWEVLETQKPAGIA
jgi:pseudaminic acid synthase